MSLETAGVNAQILDSVATVDAIATGLAPPGSLGMLDAVMAETLGMAMYNAVHRQQNAAMIGSAAVTAACARMLNAFPAPRVEPPPPPPPPPSVDPLPVPPPRPMPPAEAIALAAAEAEFAVGVLRNEATAGGAAATEANDALAAVAAAAAPTPPPAPAAAHN